MIRKDIVPFLDTFIDLQTKHTLRAHADPLLRSQVDVTEQYSIGECRDYFNRNIPMVQKNLSAPQS